MVRLACHVVGAAWNAAYGATCDGNRPRSLAEVKKEACVFCGQPSDAPEHVYPTWFLKSWDNTGPFSVHVDGAPVRARSGAPATSVKMWRVMLPCCLSCNGTLDSNFEKPAKEPIRRLLRDVMPLLDRADVHITARWLVKTLGLAAHPDANHTAFASRADTRKKNRNNPWGDYPRGLLNSLRVGLIPADLSLWLAVTNANERGLPDPEFEEVLLRCTRRADGEGGCGQTRTSGFGLPDGRIAWFQLVHHPLHDLTHPFEAEKLVTRLWPDPPTSLDIRVHPVLDHSTRLALVFSDGLFAHELQPGRRSIGNGTPW